MFALDQRLPALLAIIAAVAMLGTTALQGYRFWQDARHINQSGQTQTARPAAVKRNEPKVDLASLSLFGTPASEGDAQAVSTENLPETNLRLFLRGVMAASGDFPGSALIEDEKSQTDVYLVGDDLPGNATLRSVFPNRVIIERSGKLENLFFPESEQQAGLSIAPDEPPETSTTESPPSNQSSSPVQAGTSDQERREEIRRRLEQLRERLRNNN
ncbi:MAG: type II secretion system protein N [Marinobacter sp.]|nr:type II secretion system protein N [Marinobacter sp.]